MLYFAYGSNLHHVQMKRRCKESFFLKKINLKNLNLKGRKNLKKEKDQKISHLKNLKKINTKSKIYLIISNQFLIS